MSTDGVILLGHGSRDPRWRLPMDAVAARLGTSRPQWLVRCAFLELMAPDLLAAGRELADLGARRVRVLQMFLGIGRHVREDVPALVLTLAREHPQVDWMLLPPVGEDERLLDLLAELALSSP